MQARRRGPTGPPGICVWPEPPVSTPYPALKKTAPIVEWWRWAMRWFGVAASVPLEDVRRHCTDLVEDIPPGQKHELLNAIAQLRSVAELRGLKPRIFNAVSLAHGEREARERIAFLERQLH